MRNCCFKEEDILSVDYCAENAIYYPVEYHLMRYMKENDILAPSFETINIVWDNWYKMVMRTRISDFFTIKIVEMLKDRYLFTFAQLINQKDIGKKIEYNMNMYGVNILFLHALKEKAGEMQQPFIELLLCFHSLKETERLFCLFIEGQTEEDWMNQYIIKKKIQMQL